MSSASDLTNHNNLLLDELINLAEQFDKANLPLIIGGGLSLFIRTSLIKKKTGQRYPIQPDQRSTKDIDIFLNSEIIADINQVAKIKNILNNLGYLPKTKYFQFTKDKDVLIDILSAPPLENDIDKVIIKKPRIKPQGITEFHAYLVEEAEFINIGLINVSEFFKNNSVHNLFILSSYNFILLKLFAFNDRINDETVDYGRHHAFDIFATILNMDENDWENANTQLHQMKSSNLLNRIQELINKYFSSSNDLGILRIKETILYQNNKREFDKYINDFINDLKELFAL